MTAPELYYFRNFRRRFQWPKKQYNVNIVRFIDSYINRLPRCSVILDACCGDGYIGQRYPQHIVWGFDEQPEALVICRNYQHGFYFQASAYDLSTLPDNRFDGIILSMALEHFEHPELALREIHRVLRQGGLLVVTVPNEASPLWWLTKHTWFRLFEGNCRAWSREVHPSRFTEHSLWGILSKGWKVQEIRKLTWGTTLAAAARKLDVFYGTGKSL